MSVISGQASGSANTASYHVSRSLWLGKHRDLGCFATYQDWGGFSPSGSEYGRRKTPSPGTGGGRRVWPEGKRGTGELCRPRRLGVGGWTELDDGRAGIIRDEPIVGCVEEREVKIQERLFTNKSNRPGDDMKEALRTDGNTAAWQAWSTTQNQLWPTCSTLGVSGRSRWHVYPSPGGRTNYLSLDSVRCWLDRRSLPSRLFDDLVPCALGPTSWELESREQDFRQQVWEAIPRGTWQSNSSFPEPTVFEELCQFAQCFYSGWLVLPAYGEFFGPDSAVTARISQRGLSDQSILLLAERTSQTRLFKSRHCGSRSPLFFLLAAAWVDPGRNALQSAEQRC